MPIKLTIKIVPGDYAIAQLPRDAAIPAWANGCGFVSISIAEDETTVVCLQERIPKDVTADRHWVCFRTLGPFDFDAAGIVHSLITPLSNNGIGVFVVCTYDGEHVLIANKDLEKAQDEFAKAGHTLLLN